MTGVKCPRAECSAHLYFDTYDGPAICQAGHPMPVTDVSPRVIEFYNRVRRGAIA